MLLLREDFFDSLYDFRWLINDISSNLCEFLAADGCNLKLVFGRFRK